MQPDYTAKELFFGPVLLKEKAPVFIKKWQHKLSKMEKILASLHQSDQDVTEKIREVTLEIEWIKEVFADAGK